MSESLGKRVARLISGGFNAVIDTVEGSMPEAVMMQAIREIETATDEVRVELGKATATKYLANKQLIEKKSKHQKLSDQLSIAVKEGRDDLAKIAIAHQMDIEAQIPVIEQSILELSENEHKLGSYIQALEAKQREMDEDLKVFRQSIHMQESSKSTHVSSTVSNSQKAFDRAMGIKSLSSDTLIQADATKLAELERLARDTEISKRLSAFKVSEDA